MFIKWFIKPLNTPAIIRSCSRCGHKSEFVCSNRFRINAQQKRLDVWLIYKCVKCNTTWNMDILTRKKPEEIEMEVYNGFLENDIALACKYAFDSETLSRSKVAASFEHVELSIEGESIRTDMLRNEPITLILKSQYELQVRLDQLLSENLGMSRKSVKACFDAKAIYADAFGFRPEKPVIRLKGDLTIQFDLRHMQYLF